MVRQRYFVGLLAVASMIFLFAPVASATIIIDNFVTPQNTTDSPGGPAAFNTVSPPPGVILGGERDVRVQVTGGLGNISVLINQFGADLFTYNEDAITAGAARVTWDGVDGSEDLDPTGLGGIDLTQGGLNTGIELQGVTTDLPVDIRFLAFTNATDFSMFVISLPPLVLTPQDFFLPFDMFSLAGGLGVDFTNIGALRYAIDTTGRGAVDMTIDAVVATNPAVPEPGTMVFLSMGVLGFIGRSAAYRRRTH